MTEFKYYVYELRETENRFMLARVPDIVLLHI